MRLADKSLFSETAYSYKALSCDMGYFCIKLERVQCTVTENRSGCIEDLFSTLEFLISYSEYQWASHSDQSTCGDGQLLMLYILFQRVHLRFKNRTHFIYKTDDMALPITRNCHELVNVFLLTVFIQDYFAGNWGAMVLMPSGGRLNKKDGLTRYGDSHVKDKTS